MISEGISRAAIFSKRVLLMPDSKHEPREFSRIYFGSPKGKGRSFHDQRAFVLFGGEAFAQVLNDLVLQSFAAAAPAPCPGHLLHATAQAPETHQPRRMPQLQ